MNPSKHGRIFYIGMINSEAYSRHIGEQLLVGAGAKKMASVVQSLREAGHHSYLISMPVLGHNAITRKASRWMCRDRKVVEIFLPTVANKYLRKLVTPFVLSWYCIKHVTNKDCVIFYNHSFEYLLGAIILALKGNRPLLDIEDAPLSCFDKRHISLEYYLFYVFRLICQNKHLIVSHALARSLGLRNYFVVYGTANTPPQATLDSIRIKWGNVIKGHPLVIHYGGSLSIDTGLDIFCATVEDLIRLIPTEQIRVIFLVTGFGIHPEIQRLTKICDGSAVAVNYMPDTPPPLVKELLQTAHASLSLRIPESKYSETTFPSKVVEISTNGVLLITSKVSDIPLLFNSLNSVVLSECTPLALKDAVLRILKNPEEMMHLTCNGYLDANRIFSSSNLGASLGNYLQPKRNSG